MRTPSGKANPAGSAEDQAESLVRELTDAVNPQGSRWELLANLEVTRRILMAEAPVQRAFARRTVALILAFQEALSARRDPAGLWYGELIEAGVPPRAAMEVTRRLLQKDLGFESAELIELATDTARIRVLSTSEPFLEPLVATLETFATRHGASDILKSSIRRLWQAIVQRDSVGRRLKDRLRAILGETRRYPIFPGEAWSDAALQDLESMAESARVTWSELLFHCRDASGSSPSTKWAKQAGALVEQLGFAAFRSRMLAWFPLVEQPRTREITGWNPEWQPNPNHLILAPHADILRGLAWCCALREDRELARALTALALSAYRKIPKIGPRAVKVGNAGVQALGSMPGSDGVGELALLKVRVRSGAAQKMIEKALEATARRVGLPREELEEMSVPAYGLTAVGRGEEVIGEYTALLNVSGTGTDIVWRKADGRTQRSVPASVKSGQAEDLKELQGAAKDIQRMLPAQRERIDTLHLRDKSWPLAVWRERYLDHPLVGVIARRLLWEFTTGKTTVTGIWFDRVAGAGGGRVADTAAPSSDAALVDLDLRPLTTFGPETVVRLWHPIGKDLAENLAWRAWLDEQRVQQPFKQAHRELYLLTDAERLTRTYSNRYAAHILRQHQFNALCAVRGWRNKLRLMVDAEFPPATLLLPRWNLRAEFWIEGAGSDYGRDTNETGTFLLLTTDQVRFYPIDAPQVTGGGYSGNYSPRCGEEAAEPIPLEQIPPLVFSEVMRDVDLFVGVASVGNDPNWADGRLDGRYQTYWQSYSFGELGTTAKTRREVIAQLLPRLRIADRCSLADRFLVVRGNLRTYRIHLGSGNILMEPNDQYLCIVPRQSAAGTGDRVLLPFEGDGTLSVILSKAFLLADDTKISDPTILSQIRSR